MFTVFVRLVLFPLNYRQIASTQKTQALTPKVQEIKEKYGNNKELQNQLTALLYQESKVNPLAGCLPAIFQIPVFIALYRSFFNLAQQNKLEESFLWLPNLQGPVFGTRSTDWLFKDWHDMVPSLGWSDTLAYLSVPALLYIAQSISLAILSPPSDDPTIKRSQVHLLPHFMAIQLVMPVGHSSSNPNLSIKLPPQRTY
jgi:YidC/Oxa1 family membrane protein insertase